MRGQVAEAEADPKVRTPEKKGDGRPAENPRCATRLPHFSQIFFLNRLPILSLVVVGVGVFYFHHI